MVDIIALIISYSSSGFLVISTVVLLIFWKDSRPTLDRRLVFVIGLVFSRYLTEYAITSVLAWYFTYYGDDLVMSSILSTVQSSLASLLVISMAHVADSHYGRFYTILFSNTAYIGGLMILWLFNPYDVKWLVVISLVLLSLGTSGGYILYDVLIDLMDNIDKPHEDETKIQRADMWTRIAYICAAISAILWVAPDAVGGVHPSWNASFAICIIFMTTFSFIFCIGHKNYDHGRLKERPSKIFFRVIGGSIKELFKCNPRCSKKISRQDTSQKNMLTETIGNEGIPQERPPPHLDAEGKEARGNNSYKQKDKEIIKKLFRMLPMWIMFFVVSIISATGFTFFLQQYSNLNVSKRIPIQIYNIVQDFSSFAILLLYSKIRCLLDTEKFKIGVGMLCGILSCIFAWQLEVYRLREVEHLVDTDLNTSISFLWLVPQFCMLGCMEGLTRDGLLNFYKSQMKEEPQLESYGEEYIELVMGLGKLMNILLVLIFNWLRGWFGDTINDSRLDKYYLVLVYVCSVNFIMYWCIARYFYKDQYLPNDDQKKDNQVLGADDQEQDNKVLANVEQEQDKQVLVDDGQEQGYQVFAGQEQDYHVLAEDDQEQDNQVLSNDDQEQDNF